LPLLLVQAGVMTLGSKMASQDAGMIIRIEVEVEEVVEVAELEWAEEMAGILIVAAELEEAEK
jgi:hypothetical protein